MIIVFGSLYYKPAKPGLLLQQQQQSGKEEKKDKQPAAGVSNSCRWSSCVNGSSLVFVIMNSLKVFGKTKTGY